MAADTTAFARGGARLVVLGGGGFRVPLVYRALIGDPAVREVVLYDTDPGRLSVIAAVLAEQGRSAERAGARAPEVRVAAGLDDALRDADFVFSAIRVGGMAGRACDERIPLAEGVLGQETVGAGGVLYGLRTLPVATAIAKRVAAVAPRAWVINFTNPAGMVTEAMRAVLGDRVIGICDSPVGLVRRAARAAGADPDRVGYDYVGLNHLGWLRRLEWRGRDLLPGLLADAAALATFEEGRLFGARWLGTLGSLPNEYLHYYYFTREAVAAAREAAATRGEFLDRQQAEFFGRAGADPAGAHRLWEAARLEREETYLAEARQASGGWQRDAADLDGGGYDRVALALMRALSGAAPARLVLNVRNGGTVPVLDEEAVVEVACEVDETGVRPLPVAPPDAHQAGLMLSVKAVERAAIEAAATGSRSHAVRALALHPLVDSAAVAERIWRRAQSAKV
ncbi:MULTISPECIES: family 4 glycosyl hydrolase [Streptomycetaceae]|uniref:6-phospho-beta-glucosidase n=1 Tax=Streptantibioticus cattleyicolor (strain ATCC 35852 / DSM 46488 / JCM 4925 / NBRC 14057 / NRRL 8057) TaxID=1003195 RepID=F8JYS3_STREN|nr:MULTISPECIES: 6-phospho-beta-glucosidase [Streptomycetaceae]AEW93963.1 6-phospho-beta-glucosidase [Streptantibioticus cattleyicolor NRRL 8057 = DSM 46488]MYS58639.1 6-phospho-beta-glucosidase [Streptomyces sp. SID5468]CCB74309.1 6-phospho-beta-glucosidase [Streptantibioticus cattleyicolor NRRL 8057 = DSM 46488]